MAPCQPWKGSFIDVVVTAESENNQFYEWREKLPVGEQVKKLAEAWAQVHGVPGTAVGFDDANGCEVDLLQTPLSLGWGIRGEVFLKAFPTEDRFMEQGQQEGKLTAETTGTGEETSAPTTAASTDSISLASASTAPSVWEPVPVPEDRSAPEAPAEVKEAKEVKEPPQPQEPQEVREPQGARQPKPSSARGRGSTQGAVSEGSNARNQVTGPKARAATPPSKAASSGNRRASSGRASAGAAAAPADSQAVPMDAEEVAFEQANPKKEGSSAYQRYEKYKRARTVEEAITLGAARGDIAHDFKRGFLKRCRAV